MSICRLPQREQTSLSRQSNIAAAAQRARYMTLETIAPLSEDPIFKLPAVAV